MQIKTEGPASARIMLVGEAPGADEAATGKNFVGHAGRVLDSLLRQTKIIREECLITNVARDQPPGNNMEFFYEDKKCTRPKPLLQKYIQMLKDDIIRYQPNIVIGLGHTALFALTGESSIEKFRGYVMQSNLVPDQKILCTYHPIKVDNEWKLQFPAIMDLRKAYNNSLVPEFPVDNRVLQASPSKREFINYLKFLYFEHKEPVSFDVETKSPGAHVDILGLADSPTHAMSFELLSNREPRYSPEEEEEIWFWLAKVLEEREVITQNGPYDISVIWYNNHILTSKLIADTLIAGHVCWPESPRSLGFLASICLNVPPWKHTQVSLPTLYNAGDAANTYGIWEVQKQEMTKQDVWNTFNFEMSQVYPASMLQLQGIPVDQDIKNKLLHSTEEKDGKVIGVIPRLKILDDLIKQIIKKPLNLKSSKQMQELLYTDLGLPEQYKRRKSASEPRRVTADAEALVKLDRMSDNPVLKLIMEYKKLDKLREQLDVTADSEGRVHTCYNIAGATSLREKKGIVADDEESYRSFGRWSSSGSIILPFGPGNLQNIQKKARKIYRVPGMVIVQADYVQAEAVIVAYLINDVQLINMFERSFGQSRKFREENHLDVHRFTAAQMFGIPIDSVTKEQRQVGKTIRHANNYSAGPGVLSAKLNISMNEAKRLMSIYHSACPQLRLWHSRIQQQLAATRSLTNFLGRKHKFTDRWGDSLFRSAYSYIPQSTVGDLLNKSLTTVYYNHGDYIHLLLQLHDAMYVYCNQHELPRVMKILRDCMMIPLSCNGRDFMIDVDFAIGETWGDMEEVEYTDYVTDGSICPVN